MGRGDGALVAFARQTGFKAATMERRLSNWIIFTLKDPKIPIRRL